MTEETYIHQLLEPEDIIRTGNYKRHSELKEVWDSLDKVQGTKVERLTEDEDNKKQDEYLKKFGA